MKGVQEFLESSTIHGLTYISTTRKLVRIFWIWIVLSGFSFAAYMMIGAMKSWSDSPISTTLETKPIDEGKFPRITVCPPKQTFTNLNYDLEKLTNLTLDNQTREELAETVAGWIQDEEFHRNVFFTEEENFLEANKHRNWYLGFTDLSLAFTYNRKHMYKLKTTATSEKNFQRKIQYLC